MNAPASNLAFQAARFSELRNELQATYGLEETDPTLWDTLDGATDLGDALASMVRHSGKLESDAASLDAQVKALRDRKAWKVERAKALRRIILHYMDAVGMNRLERPDFVATPANRAPGLIGLDALDASRLPDSLVRIKREPDAAAIKDAIKAGLVIQGVSLGNPSRSLTVR